MDGGVTLARRRGRMRSRFEISSSLLDRFEARPRSMSFMVLQEPLECKFDSFL